VARWAIREIIAIYLIGLLNNFVENIGSVTYVVKRDISQTPTREVIEAEIFFETSFNVVYYWRWDRDFVAGMFVFV
jgi:hypothetical protein